MEHISLYKQFYSAFSFLLIYLILYHTYYNGVLHYDLSTFEIHNSLVFGRLVNKNIPQM